MAAWTFSFILPVAFALLLVSFVPTRGTTINFENLLAGGGPVSQGPLFRLWKPAISLRIQRTLRQALPQALKGGKAYEPCNETGTRAICYL